MLEKLSTVDYCFSTTCLSLKRVLLSLVDTNLIHIRLSTETRFQIIQVFLSCCSIVRLQHNRKGKDVVEL
jgi:hypothetical protein